MPKGANYTKGYFHTYSTTGFFGQPVVELLVRSIEDVITLQAVLAKQIQKNPTPEAIALSDALNRAIAKPEVQDALILGEDFNLSATGTNTFSEFFNDFFVVADQVSKEAQKAFEESPIQVSEAFDKQSGKFYDESLIISDTFNIILNTSGYAESVGLAESYSITINKDFSESMILGESDLSIQTLQGDSTPETVDLAEEYINNILRPIDESFLIGEAFTIDSTVETDFTPEVLDENGNSVLDENTYTIHDESAIVLKDEAVSLVTDEQGFSIIPEGLNPVLDEQEGVVYDENDLALIEE